MSHTISQTYSRLAQRFGLIGLLFFFIKGLLWLIAPFVFAWFV